MGNLLSSFRVGFVTRLRAEGSVGFLKAPVRRDIDRRLKIAYNEKTSEAYCRCLTPSHFDDLDDLASFTLTVGNIYAFDDISDEEFTIPITSPHLLLFCNSIRTVQPLTRRLTSWKDLCIEAPVFLQTLTIPVTSGLQFRTFYFDTNEVTEDDVRPYLEVPALTKLKCMLCIAYCGQTTLATVASTICQLPIMNVSCHEFGVGDLNQISMSIGLCIYGDNTTYASIFNFDIEDTYGSKILFIKIMKLIDIYCNGMIIAFTDDQREPLQDFNEEGGSLQTEPILDLVEKFYSLLTSALPATVKLVEFSSKPDLICFNLRNANMNTTKSSICQVGLLVCLWN